MKKNTYNNDSSTNQEETINCLLCSEKKNEADGHFTMEQQFICQPCIEEKNVYSCVYQANGTFLGIEKKEETRKWLKADEAVYVNSFTVIVLDTQTEAKCNLCNEVKRKEEVAKKFCQTCIQEKANEGIVETILGLPNKRIYVSTEKAKELISKRAAVYLEEGTLRVTNCYTAFTLIYQNISNKQAIVVSRSGKWSAEATKEEEKALLDEGLAEEIRPGVIRMNINIEQFKTNIIKRDKRRCTFCNKKAHGVFSRSKVKTYANSVCACIECEYKLDPKKFLNWLNIEEERSISMTHLPFKKKKGCWLYDVTGTEKYLVRYATVKQLVDEEMAEWKNENEAVLKYNALTFRSFIVEREEKKCHYCKKKGKTVDHVIPKSKGGLTTPHNCVCACERCNTKKGNTDKEAFLQYLQQNDS